MNGTRMNQRPGGYFIENKFITQELFLLSGGIYWIHRQSPIFVLLTKKLPFSYFMQIGQLFIVLRQTVNISVTVYGKLQM